MTIETGYYLSEETYVGPEEEIDKLESIKWNLVSSSDGGSLFEFASMKRISPNEIRFQFQINEDVFMDDVIASMAKA